MTKMFYAILLIIFLTTLMLRAQTPPFAGSGTSGDPYQINSAALFDSLRNPTWGATDGLYFILTADIDLSGYADWTPIPELRGNLDGQWHTISNMTITTIPDDASDVIVGLFKYVYRPTGAGTNDHNIQNLRIRNFTIDINNQVLVNNVHHYIGFVAGYLTGGVGGNSIYQIVVDSSFVKVQLNTTQRLYVGGIVGYEYIPVVYRCLVRNTVIDTIYAPISGGSYAGGIIGASYFLGTKQCAFKGDIRLEQTNTYGGAIVGYGSGTSGTLPDLINNNGTLDCYARGKQINADGGIFSGLVARFADPYGNYYMITNSYMQSDSNYAPPRISDGRIYTGNLVGYSPSNKPKIYKSYWDISTDKGNKLSIGYPNGVDTTGTGIIDDSLKSQTFLENNGWNFTTVWKIDPAKNDGYPYLQWEDNIPDNSINVTLPLAGTYVNANDSITVKWTGTGDYQNVIINSVDTFLAVSTAKIVAPSTPGVFIIKVVILSDTTVYGSTYVNVLADSSIDIISASITADSFSTEVITSGLDSIRFYLSNGINSPTYVADAHITRSILDSTYSLPIPNTFHNIGSSITLIVNQDVDTTTVNAPTIHLAGQYGGWQGTCWSPKDTNSVPIEVMGIYDPGCNWVNTTQGYTTTWANFLDDTTYLSQGVNYWTFEQRQHGYKVWQQRMIYMTDTTTGVPDSVDIRNLPQYNNTGDGASIVFQNRRYNIIDSVLYISSLTSGTSSIEVDLHSYYIPSGISATPFINPKLYLFQFATQGGTDSLVYDGNYSTLNLPLLKTPKIGIYEKSLDQALYYFDALPYPIPKTLVSDSYVFSGKIKIIRNYFRGIDPAFIRNPHK